jgi:hypothetical protein
VAQDTILFVHGTGVRLKDYRKSFSDAQWLAAEAGITARLVECAWGDPLGVQFQGLSLPDPPTAEELARDGEDFARWSCLFADPLFELDKLAIRDPAQAQQKKLPPSVLAPWQQTLNKLRAYQPSDELVLLLRRGGLEALWPRAWPVVMVTAEVTPLAFQHSAHELPEAAAATARALVAQLHLEAQAAGLAGPSRVLREALVNRLMADWGQQVLARSGFFARMFKRMATSALKEHRHKLSAAVAMPVGDILLYQSHGAEIRQFIRDKVEQAAADGPVTLLAHSLGGIACFDLMALPDPPAVDRLITVGSQSPFFYELGALTSLKPPQPLPEHFPPWLNIFDRNDLLSYLGERLFDGVTDQEVDSGQPFPDSHSAYFNNEEVWKAVRDFKGQPKGKRP